MQDYSDDEDSMIGSGVFISNNNSALNSVNLEDDDSNSDDSDESETYDQRIEADPPSSPPDDSDLLQQNLSQIVDPYPNNNPYSNDNLYDPQNYEYDYKSQASESLYEEYQATSEFVNPTPINYGELLNDYQPNNDSEKNNQNLINNSSKIRARKDNKRTESKNYFREAIRSHKNNSIDSNEFGKDLAECIPGLYRLLDLSKVDGSSSSVDRMTISKDSLKKLCNNIIPSSFKSISEIDYEKLNSISFRLIGCYGNHFLIAKFLLNKKIIDQKIHDLLITSDNKNKSSLRPGIYLLVVDQGFDLGLVIHWSEPGCYEENASLQHKNNMIYLHRCLTKLTDCQFCFMSDKDLDSFDWNLNSLDLNSDHENGSCYEFEVKSSQEEKDDFEINLGFKMDLPNEIKTEIKNNIQYDVPLYPIVVESATNISFITRKMAISSDIESLSCSTFTFSTELRNRLQGRSLSINRESMNMKQLEILINNGFEAEKELLNPFHDALNALKLRKKKEIDQLKHTIKDDAEIITRIGWKKSYSIFETYVDNDNAANNNISEEKINRIQSKYPEVKDMMKEIKIDSSAWIKLKQRYALSYIFVRNVYKLLDKPGKISDEKNIDNALQELYCMFVDKETDTHKLFEKYVKRSQQALTGANLTFNRIEQQAKIFTQNKNDSDFVQEYLTKPFFGKKNNFNQKVLEVFLNEYQNWKKESFPNTVKEMVSGFSFNKEEMEKIREKFSQEKKDIENREFEKIRSKLEKNYNNGPLRVNVLEIINEADEDNVRLTYKLETNQLQITIYETLLKESDILKIQDDEFYISNPILSPSGVDFLINPIVYDFRKISQIDICKFLLVLYNKNEQQIEIYFDTAQKLAQGFKESSIKPFKIWKSDKNFLMAINEPKELIAIFDTRNVVLSVFAFIDDKTNLYARDPEIPLLQRYSGTTPNIQHFLFIKDTEEICFVEKGGQARIFNLVNKKFRPTVCNLPPNTSNVLSSPDGSCIVAFAKKTTIDDEQEICRAYVYFCTNFGNSSINKVVKLPPTIQSLEFLQFICVNKLQTHLMSFNLKKGCLVSAIVKITLEKTQYRFQERMQRVVRVKLANPFCNYALIEGKYTQFEKYIQNGQKIEIMGEKFNIIKVISDTELKVAGNFKSTSRFDGWMEFQIEPIEPKPKLNNLIDVYKLMFEKYPIENWIDSELNNPLNLKIVLDIDDDIEEYDEKFEYYIYENLRYSTKKLATILKKFSVSFTKFQELVENVKFLKKCSSDHSPEYKLDEWMIKLCCLIPIKIAVTRNNLFQPLNDEMNEVDWVESDNGYGHYVNNIAKNISFGLYEGILKHFSDKKVKVISSVGEQSCENLNHLVGTSFNESAMRCTEGVWMSLVNTKEYIYVTLYFENFKHQEISPQEDLLLTMLNTAVSNLILFKNQSRDMLSMAKKFQDGARLFETDSEILQAKLCIILKDVSKTEEEVIVKEFRSKISQLVSEEGKDNFISRMYKGRIDIVSWPKFDDAGWSKTLFNISKKLVRQEVIHEDANNFLQNIKIIMAKLKICDWTSLEKTFIQIRVATLTMLLPTAVSYGLEQEIPIIEHLVNRDSGELIDDQIVILSDILSGYEGSTIILPDSDIQLYDEHESFERLSEDLRCYFEDHVQPRKESSNDREWFANFEKFFKYIIKRRVLRVQNWYMQNTAKFPQDNSDVVNGKYAMEQELSKLTLLWTLCGLTCHQCGLKCVKNRDHQEDHDCLTDHKCHSFCHFTEAHNDNLILKCSHKAGHEGKHACDKISHLCGKPCSLNDKRNCQKVCSKEIGHDDREHLCQSTIHYCGEDCSLSTYTEKGDYQCPNKCVKPSEEPHESHSCENKTCPIQCPIPNCQKKCISNKHFHSYDDLEVSHFCGNEHPCQENCEDDGICNIVTEPKRQIAFTKCIQKEEKLRCSKKIPPYEFEHTGKHMHQDNGFHYCDKKCPFCEYYCTLPYGHTQSHDTKHGNMIIDDDNEFDFTRRKLKDQRFILCNLRCKDLGRHRHTDYYRNEESKNEESCQSGNQRHDIKHVDEQINLDKPKDFISHKLLWERTGFKDPYSVQEREEFTKCFYVCSNETHQGANNPSYCELPLFHAPLDQNDDGHRFNCEHPE
ncbi:hypothetical protein C1646_812662 [Rhizophagus diaphanus]|nr:hypothetical protein C1646_812662 [Rhizophagus diaphanus] [Rhizophagus sp. MUCL 43196]